VDYVQKTKTLKFWGKALSLELMEQDVEIEGIQQFMCLGGIMTGDINWSKEIKS
jgi:hypothetical protein